MKIISKQEAVAQGLTSYFTGKACKHGHIALRHVWNSGCSECSRLREPTKSARRRTLHPEKIKEYKRRDYEKRKAKVLASCARYRKENKEARNKYFRQYKKEHSGLVAASNKKRDLAKKNRVPKWLTSDDVWIIKEIYALAALRTKLTKVRWHVDHIVPLQGRMVSGLHTPANLRVVLGKDNLTKSNNLVEELL